MKTNEVETVQSEHGALLPGGERQHLFVGDFLIRTSRFVGVDYIVSETSQFFNGTSWKVLIGVE